MKRKSQAQARKQPTPDELLEFLQRKFYSENAVAFNKDRRRLLDWVVLWPASWLDQRGVTITADKYKELFYGVFLDGLRFGNTGNITYLPAWLAKVIQSHFAHHGDEIYEQAKSFRTLVENAVTVAGKMVKSQPDPVRDLAAINRALKPKKKPAKRARNDQLNLL